ncbi:MAG: biotin/lipoyl-containing protein [Candidatus Thalassarchaeaceae archaeon]|jgi:biotin carboxyl carrier protein|nr:biotin/lipoyl-containing protein [Candidatus Thalassarchaeaceae archaeon]MDP6317964.1 biotin/lipoyl-containing protein [Candidatus Thalassarchaeaceae archaeon]HJM30367.1 biotin/lipoyl-containing protein [Candidatus Thalassarchaeaceae archaeon]HJN70301.1 biotin/lipoyl-containing protein [Candidatus Thalassarchaeaceae archaeon]|tara:strand:- start:1281 stop:1697 length:417 start_codon:yes stop_codon:yes gene_type:complete
MAKTRKVTVDGDEFEVELEKIDGVWQVKVGGKEFTISVEGKSVEETTGKKRKRTSKGKLSGTISSTIPGKIVSINTDIGNKVKEGDVLMILEAMKMQNEIHAPISGTVSEVNYKPGDSVEANAPLLVITPEGPKPSDS